MILCTKFIKFLKNTLYGLDNAYYLHTINLSEEDIIKYKNNIEIIRNFFINEFLLPNRLRKNNIVIHFRKGDAMKKRKNDINEYNNKILKIIDIFAIKYSNYTYYIHTDVELDDFIIKKLNSNKINYNIYNKKISILQVLSDFIYAKILVCGCSCLSKICSFFGNKELIIYNYNKQLIYDKACIIDNYIKLATI